MLSNPNSLEGSSLHHPIEEDLVEDKHVSVLRGDLLNPLHFHFVSCSIELNVDLRQVRQVDHGVEAVSVHNKDLKLLSKLVLGSSHKFSHDHRVIGHFRGHLQHVLVDSVVSRGSVEFEAEVVGKELLGLAQA